MIFGLMLKIEMKIYLVRADVLLRVLLVGSPIRIYLLIRQGMLVTSQNVSKMDIKS